MPSETFWFDPADFVTGDRSLKIDYPSVAHAGVYLETTLPGDLKWVCRSFKQVFAPLEVLSKMNRREFDRYFDESTAEVDREFIEKNIWAPNNQEIKRIIMEKSHLFA